jgi:hypothetical protein
MINLTQTFYLALFSLFGLNVAASNIGIRAQSMGGAYRSLAQSNDIIFYNPAGLLKHRLMGADAYYQWGFDDESYRLGALLADAKTADFGLGLGYGAKINNNNKPVEHDVKAAFSIPIMSDILALGTSFSYTYQDQIAHKHFFNMDVGVLVNAPLGLAFAAVLERIIPPKGLEKPMGLSVSLAFEAAEVSKFLPLSLALDWQMANVKSDKDLGHTLGLGLEYRLLPFLPVRLGFKTHPKDSDHWMSLGSGICIKAFSLEGVYEQHLLIGKNRSFGISVGVAL